MCIRDSDFSSAPAINSVELAETLLRCTQEAITNVLRHSSGDHCSIELRGEGDHCILSIRDNGTPDKHVEAGNGLKGMTERVAASGGKVSWQQNEDGFNVQISLALEGAR